MLKFNVKNQIIKRTDEFNVVADSKNYLTATFTFTEEWTGEIIAIFENYGKYYNVLLVDNSCIVPWEVIKADEFTVSVVCGDRITANAASVEVKASGYVEGETPKEPTPDVYVQLLNSARPPYIGENKNWYVWDAESKAYFDKGVSAEGYTPQKGIDYYTEDDKAEMVGAVLAALPDGDGVSY